MNEYKHPRLRGKFHDVMSKIISVLIIASLVWYLGKWILSLL